jgi:hypothetical protein
MIELLSRFNPEDVIALVAVVGGLIVGPAIAIFIHFNGLRKTEILTRLKQDMLDRGMSAEEIKMVLEAGMKK